MRGNSSTVVADGGGGLEARGREPGESPTETITKHSDSHIVECAARMAERGGNIFQGCVQAYFHDRGHSPHHIGGSVGQFEMALDAVDLRGVIIGESAYVLVYSEDFLDKNNRGLLRPAVPGNIGIELVAIGSSQSDV